MTKPKVCEVPKKFFDKVGVFVSSLSDIQSLLKDPRLLAPGLAMDEYPLELRFDSELQVDTGICWGLLGTCKVRGLR